MRELPINIICNKCGRKLLIENQIAREDYLQVNKPWGYFSKKDGKTYQFVLCENCCDKLIEEFKVPVNIKDTTELL